MGSSNSAHPFSPPPKTGSAKHSLLTTHPDERSPHLSGEHAGKRANTCEKLSVRYGKKHSNPPHPTPAQLQPLNPTLAHPETRFPFQRVSRPAGNHLPVPAAPKSGVKAVNPLLPSSSPTPACPSIPRRAGDPFCGSRAAPGARGCLRWPGCCGG